MQLDITTLDAGAAGTIDLPDAIFGLEPRADILHRMVRYQQLKRMAGTHHAKDRSLVTATRAKMYKQKGTGKARHGNKTAPQFRGGGKAFGPVPRSHAIDLTKKFRALALRHALSAKAQAGEIAVLDKAEMAAPKTAELRRRFDDLGWSRTLVIGGAELDANFALAARNLIEVDVLPVQGINVYDVLKCRRLVLTRAALEALEARFNNGKPSEAGNA